MTPPVLLKPQQPTPHVYPPFAVRMNEEGSAIVGFTVDERGQVTGASITQSTGYPDLDAASIATPSGRTYQPAMLAGKPIACRNLMRVTWKLSDDDRAMAGINMREMGPADYPAQAKADKEEGVTLILLLMDENGKIVNSAVVKSSGFGDLDAASLDLIYGDRKAAPARFFGKPVKTGVVFGFRWSLDNNSSSEK